MKLTFLGAAREVTGSCTLIEAGGHRFLVDCGMEQGKDVYPNADLPCAPGEIEAILLTHAHIDHSGRIPYLYKNGFRGPIYSTDATMDLCEIMLEDSAHIQEQEAEWKNRKAQRSGNELVEPDYTVEDAMAVMKQFVPQSYGKPLEVFPGITAAFTDVGHLLGSASITLQVTENGESQTIVFSGDIGNLDQPLIRNPQYLTKADFVVMESTYGDRTHGPKPDYVAELTQILQETFDRGGNVVIPSFAVGRTQAHWLGLRPEAVALDDGSGGSSGVAAAVHSQEYLGADAVLRCAIGTEFITVRAPGQRAPAADGQGVRLRWCGHDQHFFDAQGQRLAA